MKYLFILLLVGCGKIKSQTISNPVCSFNPAFGQCQITNSLTKPISCKFTSSAKTLHGFPIVAYQWVYLYQGMSAWNYAKAFNPVFDPIVEMTGSADCKEQ